MTNLVRVVRRHLKLAVVGDQEYPKDHLFAMAVPKGGSACSKCKFAGADGKHCGNEYFQKWQKSMGQTEDPGLLPEPADEYCCDVFEASTKSVSMTRQASLRGLLGLPERVAYRFQFENLPAENGVKASLPGDDVSNHPANIYANNPFMNRDPLAVRRALHNGVITDPKLKLAATEYLDFVARMTGWNTLGDSSKREGQRY